MNTRGGLDWFKVYGKKKIKVMSTWGLATRKYGADIIDWNVKKKKLN